MELLKLKQKICWLNSRQNIFEGKISILQVIHPNVAQRNKEKLRDVNINRGAPTYIPQQEKSPL